MLSPWADTIYKLKEYSMGRQEGWDDTARRVPTHVMAALGYGPHSDEVHAVYQLIRDRKFIPGGRYLYATGRPLHQTQNCFSGQTRFVTDRGVRTLEEAAGEQVRVLGRYGRWEDAEVRSFGDQEILRVTFSNGSEVETTAGHRWWQRDGSRVTTLDLEEVPFTDPDPETYEVDAEGIRHGIIFGDGHLIKGRYSQIIFVNPAKDESLVSYFERETRSVTVGGGAKIAVDTVRSTKRGTIVSLQPKNYKELPTEYSPAYARGFMAGLIATDGCVPTAGGPVIASCEGLEKANRIAEIAVVGGCVVNSVRVVNRVNPFTGEPREMCAISIKPFSAPIILPSHIERMSARRLTKKRMTVDVESIESTGRVETVYCVVAPETESFTLANGLSTSNCFMFRAEDSREGWGDLWQKAGMALLTGGGIGVDYSEVRPRGAPIRRTGGTATGPVSLMQTVNEIGRQVQQGGSRRSAIWAGLRWDHDDVEEFIRVKDWDPRLRALKADDLDVPMRMELTNVSVILDDAFFEAYHDAHNARHSLARRVYGKVVEKMLTTGEPGFSIDVGANAGETLRNACTEATSYDDSDVCNLGSLSMGRFGDASEFEDAVDLASLFLLAGTEYSDVPFPKVSEVRAKNRRLGLGLMGVHEWMLQRGLPYGPSEELDRWLGGYALSGYHADTWADAHSLARPVKTRSIAPTGTIAIVGETTTGMEPVFCKAYKRRYLDTDRWMHQFVVDPTVGRLVRESGIDPHGVEDAYSLDAEQRVATQAFMQRYVDQAISSTINLSAPVTDPAEQVAFGEMLVKYLPSIRGITCYPDGARGGQPLGVVDYDYAVEQEGVVFEESEERCVGGACGV